MGLNSSHIGLVWKLVSRATLSVLQHFGQTIYRSTAKPWTSPKKRSDDLGRSKLGQQVQSFVCVPPWRRVTFKFWEKLKNASEVTLVIKNIFFLKNLNFVRSFVECKVSLADGIFNLVLRLVASRLGSNNHKKLKSSLILSSSLHFFIFCIAFLITRIVYLKRTAPFLSSMKTKMVSQVVLALEGFRAHLALERTVFVSWFISGLVRGIADDLRRPGAFTSSHSKRICGTNHTLVSFGISHHNHSWLSINHQLRFDYSIMYNNLRRRNESFIYE